VNEAILYIVLYKQVKEYFTHVSDSLARKKKKKRARLTNLKQNKRNLRATTEEDTGRDQVGRGGDTAPSALGPAGRPSWFWWCAS
jgi:hypothetical protein